MTGIPLIGHKTVTYVGMYGEVAIRKAVIIYNSLKHLPAQLRIALRDEIVKPKLHHINQITKMVNDPDLLTHDLLLAFRETEARK